MGVLPHIIWAPSSLSSCCLLPQSPLCVLRPIQLSPMPQATTFPTPTGLPSPTLLLPDARTRPVLWCLVPTVVSFPSELFQRLLPMLLPRPTPGCCMVPTVTDLHMEATTAMAITTPPMPTLEAAVTISVVLSPVPLAGRTETKDQNRQFGTMF